MNKADHPEGKHDGYWDYHYDNEEVGESRSAGSYTTILWNDYKVSAWRHSISRCVG